jgi:hypothetical protein
VSIPSSSKATTATTNSRSPSPASRPSTEASNPAQSGRYTTRSEAQSVDNVHTHSSPVQSISKAVPKPGARLLCFLHQEPSETEFRPAAASGALCHSGQKVGIGVSRIPVNTGRSAVLVFGNRKRWRRSADTRDDDCACRTLYVWEVCTSNAHGLRTS